MFIYSSGYDPSPSLTSNHFSIFEMASCNLIKIAVFATKLYFENPDCNLKDIMNDQGKSQILSEMYIVKGS